MEKPSESWILKQQRHLSLSLPFFLLPTGQLPSGQLRSLSQSLVGTAKQPSFISVASLPSQRQCLGTTGSNSAPMQWLLYVLLATRWL